MYFFTFSFTFLGPSNEFTRGFLGFSIYISNTTNKNDGILCFKDTNYTASNIPEVFTTNCPYHGQYVIYYNERLPRVPYPREYSKFAYNDLCEVEVKGTFYLIHTPFVLIYKYTNVNEKTKMKDIL